VHQEAPSSSSKTIRNLLLGLPTNNPLALLYQDPNAIEEKGWLAKGELILQEWLEVAKGSV